MRRSLKMEYNEGSFLWLTSALNLGRRSFFVLLIKINDELYELPQSWVIFLCRIFTYILFIVTIPSTMKTARFGIWHLHVTSVEISTFSACASFRIVGSVGICLPCSIRHTVGWYTPALLARARWLNPCWVRRSRSRWEIQAYAISTSCTLALFLSQ